jgi:hypothetical protein
MDEQPAASSHQPEPVQVLRVREGVARPGAAERIFSVVLSAPTAELGSVAAAVDPETGLSIPAEGQPHPSLPKLVARPPTIYAVGLRKKGGPWLATRTNFYNVRVRYEPR